MDTLFDLSSCPTCPHIGATTGLREGGDVPFQRLVIEGTHVTSESAADSKLGRVVLNAELTVEGSAIKGAAPLASAPSAS